MILPDLVLPSRVGGKTGIQLSGLDTLEQCLNKQHFLDYPHTVNYQYNSRGFRDSEWPDSANDLQNAIWCIGDSFTVGIGSPYEFTWPQILSKVTGRRCVNISLDGASNTWISRRACQIIQEIKPTHMVVLWSYTHRRELPDTHLTDELRRIVPNKDNVESECHDILDFISCYTKVNSCAINTNVFNSAIPRYTAQNFNDVKNEIDHIIQSWNNIKDSTWGNPPMDQEEFDLLPSHIKSSVYIHIPDIPQILKKLGPWGKFILHNQLLQLSNLDYARDYHHFDRITSEFFVQEICKNFNHTNS